MSFTDQKQRVATQEHINALWLGSKGNFRCHLCGHKFKVGDKWRWIFTNDMPKAGGNPIVCEKCDGEDVVSRWKDKHKEWDRIETEFWWFTRRQS